jgi:hypothetical protein
MAKGANQKLKLAYIAKLFYEQTDDLHSVTMQDILDYLSKLDIKAERKSIYSDIDSLREYGMDIIGEQKNKTYYYHVGNRKFEIAELKLLVDSVQASKFITLKKSNELIKKIESMASIHEADQLQRQVCVSRRIKTMNESIYYNVDKIHEAISKNCKVRFKYFQWNLNKEMELKKEGAYYCISPWYLTYDDENYYMLGYDSEAGIAKHYRVDKMLSIDCVDEKREGEEEFAGFDIAEYSKMVFGMFDGEVQNVKIEFDDSLVGVVIDRFGKSVHINKSKDGNFFVNVPVVISPQFFGWLLALGSKARILEPKAVRSRLKDFISDLAEVYDD